MHHTATEHPISWFMERDREGNLSLQPNFQRRRVWTDRQKSNLIESILLELPVPEIYMQVKTDPDGRSQYIVVDGQQRISAILEFIGMTGREPFELRYLDENSVWRGYTFTDLNDDKKSLFYGHSMAVRYLQNAQDSEIEDLFRRLNKYLTPLNAQEIRNATYRGPFLRLSESFAEDEFWSENGLAKPDAIRRMRDIEFISDLMIGVLHGPQSGNTSTLDRYYAVYEDHDREFPGQREGKKRFANALQLIQETLPDIKSTRWSNKTDFYSLFVVVAHLLRDGVLRYDRQEVLSSDLHEFETHIQNFQEDETASVPQGVVDYVGAMRRGSSDQARRGVRHRALLQLISRHFGVRPRASTQRRPEV